MESNQNKNYEIAFEVSWRANKKSYNFRFGITHKFVIVLVTIAIKLGTWLYLKYGGVE